MNIKFKKIMFFIVECKEFFERLLDIVEITNLFKVLEGSIYQEKLIAIIIFLKIIVINLDTINIIILAKEKKGH